MGRKLKYKTKNERLKSDQKENLIGIIDTEKKSINDECVNIINGKKWTRNCPKCNKKLFYKNKYILNVSIKLNGVCLSCSNKQYSRKEYENKYHRKCPKCDKEIWYKFYGNFHKAELNNYFCIKCGQKYKFKNSFRKRKCSVCNKDLYYKTLRKYNDACKNNSKCLTCYINNQKGTKHNVPLGRKVSDVTKEKLRKFRTGRKSSEETKRKIRLYFTETLRQKYGNTRFPNFNLKSCEYFQWLNMWTGWDGKHALNGGEYYIKELGYWVDYYELTENIVIEWDEKRYHYKNGNLSDKDINRMNEIKNHLNCRFFRFNEKLNEMKEY